MAKKNRSKRSMFMYMLTPQHREAAKALGIKQVNKPSEYKRVNDYVNSFKASKADPVIQQAARNAGVSNYNSINDYAKAVNFIAGGNAGGNSSSSGGGSGNNQSDPFQDLRDQITQAQQTIADLQNKSPKPYTKIEELLAQQQSQVQAQQDAMAAQAAQQQQALQDLMIQQQKSYETQMAEARRQQEAMAAQAAEAQRQAMAVQNARVPSLEPTATAPALGDGRSATRSAATNTLSNLAILTGLGTSAGVTATPATATPLAGLQIA